MRDRRAVGPLTQVAMVQGNNMLRFWAAMGVVAFADGAIDDACLIPPIRDYYEWLDGLDELAHQKHETFNKVAQHGTTWGSVVPLGRQWHIRKMAFLGNGPSR